MGIHLHFDKQESVGFGRPLALIFYLSASDPKPPPHKRESGWSPIPPAGLGWVLPMGKQSKCGKINESTDTDSKIRAAGWSAMAKIEGKKAQKELLKVAREASPLERQAALAKLPSPEVESLIEELLAEALQGKLPRVMDLELEEAIKARKSPALAKAFGPLLEKNRPLNLEGFEAAMEGGDAEKGRQLFLYKGELACQRCHQIGEAGGIVGPALHDIGVKKDRKYLLESLIFPNRQIAEGFETLVVTLHSGKTLTGILKAESATELTLLAADGQTLKVKKSDIDERQKGLSAMPADLPKHLTKSEIRDLIEFLAQQKREKK